MGVEEALGLAFLAEDSVSFYEQAIKHLEIEQIAEQKVNFLLLMQINMQFLKHRHCYKRLYC